MDNGKLFLVEKETFVVIRNEHGDTVSFNSFEEFNKYNSLDLVGKKYICYEPDRGIYIDSTIDDMNRYENTIKIYEDVIAEVTKIKTNVEDPYYNKSINEGRIKAKELLSNKAEEYINNKWSFRQQINASLGLYNQTIIDSLKQKMLDVMTIINTTEIDIDTSNTVAEIKIILENTKTAIINALK